MCFVFASCSAQLSSTRLCSAPPLLMHQADPIFSPPFWTFCRFTFSHKRRIIYKAGAQAICMATVATCRRWPILSRVDFSPAPSQVPAGKCQNFCTFTSVRFSVLLTKLGKPHCGNPPPLSLLPLTTPPPAVTGARHPCWVCVAHLK